MTVILGAANAYLGLRAGITIAATYPAAVIGMAVLRLWKGTVLEENIARTSGTIGEGIAAGAIFTIPAFLMAKAWPSFSFADAYIYCDRGLVWYQKGRHDRAIADFDRAIKLVPQIEKFLTQKPTDVERRAASMERLRKIIEEPVRAA